MSAKTPDEIKKGLECCTDGNVTCTQCPYYGLAPDCSKVLRADYRALFQQLEAERDAAVSELIGTCQVCRWEDTEKCADCHFNPEAWNVHESKWEWRGVQKEAQP